MDMEVTHRRLSRDLKILELLIAKNVSQYQPTDGHITLPCYNVLNSSISPFLQLNPFNPAPITPALSLSPISLPNIIEPTPIKQPWNNLNQPLKPFPISTFVSAPGDSSHELVSAPKTKTALNIKITGVQGFQQPVTRIFYCDKCGYGTAWKSALVSHVKQIHMKLNKLECLVCGFVTRRKRVLKAHMKSHKGVLTFHCPWHIKDKKKRHPCKFTTRLKNLFNLHKQRHRLRQLQLQRKKITKCPECWFSSSNKNMLLRHKHIHHSSQKPHLPVISNIEPSYVNDYYMYFHFGMHPFRCAECSYVTSSKENMAEHTRKHKVIYHCPECPYSCSFKTRMILHLREHEAKKSSVVMFKCIFCSYETKHKNALYTHIRTHTHDRPYRCHICEYSAIQKVHLDAHMYKHNGVLPFKCSLCKYKTATKASLKAHMCKHTGVKPFRCEFCEYRSARKADLKKHISIRHKEQYSTIWG